MAFHTNLGDAAQSNILIAGADFWAIKISAKIPKYPLFWYPTLFPTPASCWSRCWERKHWCLQKLGPATYTGDCDRVPSSLLGSCLLQAASAIWGVNWQMGASFFCVCPCLFVSVLFRKQTKKYKNTLASKIQIYRCTIPVLHWLGLP